jgi:hypothetical protein
MTLTLGQCLKRRDKVCPRLHHLLQAAGQQVPILEALSSFPGLGIFWLFSRTLRLSYSVSPGTNVIKLFTAASYDFSL